MPSASMVRNRASSRGGELKEQSEPTVGGSDKAGWFVPRNASTIDWIDLSLLGRQKKEESRTTTNARNPILTDKQQLVSSHMRMHMSETSFHPKEKALTIPSIACKKGSHSTSKVVPIPQQRLVTEVTDLRICLVLANPRMQRAYTSWINAPCLSLLQVCSLWILPWMKIVLEAKSS